MFQLNFSDIDLDSFPAPYPPNLPLFVTIGLVTEDLAPKPALMVWDKIFARTWLGRLELQVADRARPASAGRREIARLAGTPVPGPTPRSISRRPASTARR